MSRYDDTARALARYAAPPPVATNSDDFDVLSIVRLVRRRLWLIAAVATVTVLLALPAIMGMVPSYYAESRLIIHDPKTSALTAAVDSGMAPLNLVTEVERLSSRTTSVDVIRELDLGKRPELNPALRPMTMLDRLRSAVGGLIGAPPVASGGEPDPLRYVVPEYLRSLTVARSPTSGVVSISFRSTDPRLAAEVPNTVLNVYLREKEVQRRVQFTRASDWFGDRIEEQEARIAVAEEAVRRFYVDRGLSAGDLEFDEGATIAALRASRTEIAGREAAILAKLASYGAAEDRQQKLALGDPTIVAGLERDLRVQKADLDRLLQIYGDRQLEVMAARSRVSDAEAALDATIDQQVGSLRVELEAVERQDSALVSALAAAREALSQRTTAVAQRSLLVRAVDWERTALDQLRNQQRTLSAEAQLPETEVEVLSPSRLPLSSDGRGRSFWLVVAVIAAGMLGLTAAVAAEILDRSVRSVHQLRNAHGIVSAGAVPALPRRAHRGLGGHLRRHPDGMFANALRSTVRELEQLSGGRFPDSLLVTSAFPNEGAPLVATALALELASAGRGVLLVDADPTKGQVHALLGSRERPGLTDFLCGKAELRAVIHDDAESGLCVIPRGSRLPVGRREKARLGEVLDHARANGLVVIFTAVPVLASADTAALCDAVEQTLLVARWGRTRPNAVESAVQRLRSRGRSMVPVTIAMVDPDRHQLYGFSDVPIYSRRLRGYFASQA